MKLVPRSPAYRRAATEANLARSSFLLALDRARSRLHPKALKEDLDRKINDTADRAKSAAVETVRNHPFILGGSLAVVIALLFRRPLLALSIKARVLIQDAWQARKK
jgi:hypothetical protein